MEKDPINNPENSYMQTEYPSFEEHMAKMRGEDEGDVSSDNLEYGAETIKSPEQRQVEDLEVLFSFCDEKDVLGILKSNSYGTLLKNDISLVDLFNANALFDEQYYGTGYTMDEWRDDSVRHNSMARVEHKQSERDYRKGKMIDDIAEIWSRGEYDRYDEYLSMRLRGMNPDDDVIRAKEAKETIDGIAGLYFGNDGPDERADEIKNIIRIRANGGELSEDQKAFLRDEQNFIADRLLYDGHVVNEKRADSIMNTLLDAEENTERYDREYLVGTMTYAKAAIDDYLRAGKFDLIYDAQRQLGSMVDKHFDVLVSTDIETDEAYEAIDGLVFGYSNPFKIAKRAKEFGLCEEERNVHNEYAIDDPDRIVDYIANDSLLREYGGNGAIFVPEQAELLKELGVSDDAILRNCEGDFSPVDFIKFDGHLHAEDGRELVEAGVDRKKIIRRVFCSLLGLENKSPFEKYNDGAFKNESFVDVLESNGFDMTDIAKTFSPNAISANIGEFIERGADAKELMKYMASYHEEFERNLVHNAEGDISESRRMWFDGIQRVVVWDENHPGGRIVLKTGMRGDGMDYVAANIDVFAENGVSSDEIIGMASGKETSPYGMLIPKMLESGKFKAREVLAAGHRKYVDFLKGMQEAGYFTKEYVETSSKLSDYYSTVIEQMSGFAKEQRDKSFKAFTETK